MINNIVFAIFHFVICLLLLIVLVFSPVKYYKYLIPIPLIITLHWIIFNGCILDAYHHENIQSNIPTDNITPYLKLINNYIGEYIYETFLKDTCRPTYIIFFIYTLIMTVMMYRLLYSIDLII